MSGLGIALGKQAVQSAGQAVNSATGMGLNWLDERLHGERRRKEQIEQQEKLTEIQKKAQMEMMGYGQDLQKEMYNFTGPASRVKQLEEAGLSVGLMYGGAGGGSGSVLGTPSANSVGGGQASDEMQRKGMALQWQNVANQNALISAQRDKIVAETDNIKQNTDTGKAQEVNYYQGIEKIKQEVSNLKTQDWLLEVQIALGKAETLKKEAETKTIDQSRPFIVSKIDKETNQIIENTKQLELQNEITGESKAYIIAANKQAFFNMVATNGLIKSNIAVNEKSIEEMSQKIQESVAKTNQTLMMI